MPSLEIWLQCDRNYTRHSWRWGKGNENGKTDSPLSFSSATWPTWFISNVGCLSGNKSAWKVDKGDWNLMWWLRSSESIMATILLMCCCRSVATDPRGVSHNSHLQPLEHTNTSRSSTSSISLVISTQDIMWRKERESFVAKMHRAFKACYHLWLGNWHETEWKRCKTVFIICYIKQYLCVSKLWKFTPPELSGRSPARHWQTQAESGTS